MTNKNKLEILKDLRDYTKALFIVDMNNGFVNFGNMANPKYNDLVPEQLKLINKFRTEEELVAFVLEAHKKNAVEFKTYPEHCVKGTTEALLIPGFILEKDKPNTKIYTKNSTCGIFNKNIQKDIRNAKNLREIVIGGVCGDICVIDLARPMAKYFDEINREIKIFAVKSAIDTFDAPGHNREEWLDMSYKFMEAAGIEVVENFEELESREKKLHLVV